MSGIISLFEQEVQEEANKFNIELIFKLIEKLESITSPSPSEWFRLYVALKIARHHHKKRYYSVFGTSMTQSVYQDRLRDLNFKIKNARRNYYVGIKQPERITASEQRDKRNARH